MLDAAIAAREQLRLGTSTALGEIAEVRVTGPAAMLDEASFGAAHKRRPTQIVEAQFALPYLIAAAIVHGCVGIVEVADIHNAVVLDLAARMAGSPAGQEVSGVTIHLRDGRTATAKVGPPLGSPENRMSTEQLMMKFSACARHAVQPLSDDVVHATIQMIRNLEEVPNVSELLRPFA
jgi:2-methylcitrate dehydratase PrpD